MLGRSMLASPSPHQRLAIEDLLPWEGLPQVRPAAGLPVCRKLPASSTTGGSGSGGGLVRDPLCRRTSSWVWMTQQFDAWVSGDGQGSLHEIETVDCIRHDRELLQILTGSSAR